MPSTNIINQINTFNSKHSLNFGNLIENEPKILIASRDNADSEFFNKNLNEYVEGFSDGQSNFWIGLNVLNKATTSNNYKLRIVATTQNDIDLIEEYFEFHVGDADSNYRLGVNRQTLGIVSNAKGFFELNNGAGFSTYDFGDHKNMSRNLAGGWWHKEGMKNSYCFTCVNKMYAQGSAATISLAQLTDQDVLKTKMYLVVCLFDYNKI
jgi:hypothetical protein